MFSSYCFFLSLTLVVLGLISSHNTIQESISIFVTSHMFSSDFRTHYYTPVCSSPIWRKLCDDSNFGCSFINAESSFVYDTLIDLLMLLQSVDGCPVRVQ